MKRFLVLSFSGQVGEDDFEFGFVEAPDRDDAYERIDEEGVGYPGGFVTNCLIVLSRGTVRKLRQMLRVAEKRFASAGKKKFVRWFI